MIKPKWTTSDHMLSMLSHHAAAFNLSRRFYIPYMTGTFTDWMENALDENEKLNRSLRITLITARLNKADRDSGYTR